MDLRPPAVYDLLALPDGIRLPLLEWQDRLDQLRLTDVIPALAEPACEGARIRLKETLAPDDGGLGMLACMLRALPHTYARYQKLGLPDDVFADTMACFSRFVGEHHRSYGTYAFDRDWWTTRQLSLRLFRIGELEYELDESRPVLHLHIPSDARLTPGNCRDSAQRARDFFRRFYPGRKDAACECRSWLLSPALEGLLPPDSRIRQFKRQFDLLSWDEDNDSCKEWVFGRRDIPLDACPTDSSLQRRMKEHLLRGGQVGEGYGRWALYESI